MFKITFLVLFAEVYSFLRLGQKDIRGYHDATLFATAHLSKRTRKNQKHILKGFLKLYKLSCVDSRSSH